MLSHKIEYFSVSWPSVLIALMAPFLKVSSQTEEVAPFYELNGIVVMEAESVPIGDQWAFETEIAGYSGIGYIVGQVDTFNLGGKGLMRFPIQIGSGGRYQLSWKSRITEGDSNTDFNDSFARLTDASGTPIDTVPNENVKIGEWYKVYMNKVNQWSYDARNKDNDPHSLSWNLEADTLYYFEISARSKGHGLDRIVLWNRDQHSFGNFENGGVNQTAPLEQLPESPRFPNTDEDEDGLPDGWEKQFGNTETDVDPDSDQDGDGRNALVEFSMGTDPTVREFPVTISVVEIGRLSWAQIKYIRSLNAERNLELIIEYSYDLEEWNVSGLREDRFVEDVGDNRRRAWARLRVNAVSPAPYFRLRVIEKS